MKSHLTEARKCGKIGQVIYQEGVMEIWTNTYSAHDVAAAANVPPATLQNWIKRSVIVGHRESDIEGGGVQGKTRRFSFYAVMQISIAAELIKASGGMDLKEAFAAAMQFAHSGDGGAGSVGDGALSNDDSTRAPGHPYHFPYGKTLLATVNGNTAIVLDDAAGNTFGKISNKLRRPNGFTVIDAGAVFDRVCEALGYHPNVVMDKAYPEDAAD
jgi:hypothetical protein